MKSPISTTISLYLFISILQSSNLLPDNVVIKEIKIEVEDARSIILVFNGNIRLHSSLIVKALKANLSSLLLLNSFTNTPIITFGENNGEKNITFKNV